MSEFQLTTPVAFIIFNRPDTTERVFAEIARARPPKLLVVGDGPRANRPGEAEKVATCRAIINQVDWPCEVLTNFSETNLGCKVRVSSGLDWVFEQVPEAIILEDDCLPHPNFFRFCEEMLNLYRLDSSIGMITGFNPQGPELASNEYFASRNSSIWGWASWRDRWAHYDVAMPDWHIPATKKKIRRGLNLTTYIYYKQSFNLVVKNSVDTWDYQWAFCLMHHGYKTIKPFANMIKNIGIEGTHSVTEDANHNVPHGNLGHGVLIRNDTAGYIQDERFFKACTPNLLRTLATEFLQISGLYKYAREIYRKIK